MQMHRFSENIVIKSSFNKALANSTQNGDSVDTFGFRRAALTVSCVTGAATTAQVKVQESADNSTWTDVTGTTIPAVAQLASLPASGNAGVAYIVDIDLAYRQRYLRASVIGTGAAGQAAASFALFQPTNAAPTQDNATLHV